MAWGGGILSVSFKGPNSVCRIVSSTLGIMLGGFTKGNEKLSLEMNYGPFSFSFLNRIHGKYLQSLFCTGNGSISWSSFSPSLDSTFLSHFLSMDLSLSTSLAYFLGQCSKSSLESLRALLNFFCFIRQRTILYWTSFLLREHNPMSLRSVCSLLTSSIMKASDL